MIQLMLNLKLRCFRQTQLQQVSAIFSGVRIHSSKHRQVLMEGAHCRLLCRAGEEQRGHKLILQR